MQVGGFYPSTASYSPVELTAQIDPAPCQMTHGVSALPFQPIRAGDQPMLPTGTGQRAAPELPPSLPWHVCAFLSTAPFIFSPHWFKGRRRKREAAILDKKSLQSQAVWVEMALSVLLTWCFHSSEKVLSGAGGGKGGNSHASCADKSNISITKAKFFSIR